MRRYPGGRIVLIDTGACYGGQLTAYCPETGATVQVDGETRGMALHPALQDSLATSHLPLR